MSPYMKATKIAIGSSLAIIAAYSLHLNYAVSAGIITLLTLQDTKKETLMVTLRRILAFFLSYLLAFLVFSLGDFTPIYYGIFLLFFTGICFSFRLEDAIAMNAVLATHYLLEQNLSLIMIKNEALLLLIGSGIGILLNLYIPNNVRQIKSQQRAIETCLCNVLSSMAEYLHKTDSTTYNTQVLDELQAKINQGIEQAYTNMNNTLFQESRYFLQYMEMRKEQYHILKQMEEKIQSLTNASPYSIEIADFMRNISITLSETQNAAGLLLIQEDLHEQYKKRPLPKDREEFETRATLYSILIHLQEFLLAKKRFVDSLSEDQKLRYWQ
ncbi:MAG: hypothetical protein PWP24_41 [Clostridiales bacterium]|nr:hypothetical protein [Clostridiales bacterium]